MSIEALRAALKMPVLRLPDAASLSIPAFDPNGGDESFRPFALAMKTATAGHAFEGGALPPCRATIHPEVKVIDAKTGIVDYIASDETLDSYREAIRAKGWRFDRFKKNAPFLDSHDYGTFGNLVGKVIDFSVRNGQLVERVQWAVDVSSNELARFGFDMTEKGYLKAVSVGFLPVKMATRWDGNETAWKEAVGNLNLSSEDAAIVRAIYLEQQQIELSACVIGANGNAVAKAHKAGDLKDEDLQKLADIGERTLSRVVGSQKTGPSPIAPAGDVSPERETLTLARDLTAAVAQLRRLTNR